MTIAIIELRSGASLAALQDALRIAGQPDRALDQIELVSIAPFRPAGSGPVRDALDDLIRQYQIPVGFDSDLPSVSASAELVELLRYLTPRLGGNPGPVGISATGVAANSEGEEILRLQIAKARGVSGLRSDTLVVLETNIDDMNPQFFEILGERLLLSGALDVWTSSIAMKKNRPAVCLHVLTEIAKRDALVQIIIEQSTTLGVRSHQVDRQSVPRRFETIETRWGAVQIKLKVWQGRVLDIAPEYDDCATLARSNDVSVRSVWAEAYNIGQVFIGRRTSADIQPTLELIDPLGARPESD